MVSAHMLTFGALLALAGTRLLSLATSAPLQDMEVQVQQAPGMAVRTVTVTLDATQAATKRFLGGYRDKRNGTMYHHADCQTEHRKVSPALGPPLGRASLLPPGCAAMAALPWLHYHANGKMSRADLPQNVFCLATCSCQWLWSQPLQQQQGGLRCLVNS